MPNFPVRRRISFRTVRSLFAISVIAALIFSITPLLPFIQTTPTAEAAPTELFFSEYIEGSSNNKALEIYNGTGASVNLGPAGANYVVQMYFNGSASAGLTISLTGTVASGDVYVLAQSAADAIILAQADQTNGSGWFNGDDAVVLRKGGAAAPSWMSSGRWASTPARSGAPVSPRPRTTPSAVRTASRRATPTRATFSLRRPSGTGSRQTLSAGSARTTRTRLPRSSPPRRPSRARPRPPQLEHHGQLQRAC